MKGKGCFTAAEADAIRELLKQLRRSDRPTQKRLRHTLRKRYWRWIRDFDKSYKGFGVADFNALVACGKITIGNCGTSGTAAPVDLGSNPQSCHEELRARYRPDKVRVLFVGESPSASGEFFYLGNSRLYHAFREAFGGPDDFLAEFQSRAFFSTTSYPFRSTKWPEGSANPRDVRTWTACPTVCESIGPWLSLQ